MPVRDLIPILQVAVGPVILISGVGLLLLTMTNRFGRIVDRTRQLSSALHDSPENARPRIYAQLQILSVRAHLVRLAIAAAALSVLVAAILIIVLFLTALMGVEAAAALASLFVAGMGLLIISIILFIRDVNLSLSALKLELASTSVNPAQLR